MIPREAAAQQGKVLLDAAEASPLVTVAAALRGRSNEWRKACKRYDRALGDELDPTIVPVASVISGAYIYLEYGPGLVIRVLGAGGIPTLQVVEEGAGASYENFLEPASPVVLVSPPSP